MVYARHWRDTYDVVATLEGKYAIAALHIGGVADGIAAG